MLIAKAFARWLPLLAFVPLYAGCLTDTSRPNTLPKRNSAPTASRDTTNPAFASRNPAALASAGTAPTPTSPGYRKPSIRPTTPLPATPAAVPPLADDPTVAKAGSPQPRVPEFTPQTPATTAGGFAPLGDAPPAPDEVPTKTEEVATGGPALPTAPVAPAAPQAQTSRQSGKIPPLPGSELDPPPLPTAPMARPVAAVEDPSSPPPIPSVVKPSATPTVPPAAGEAMPQLRAVHKKAAAKFATIDSYVARLRRREQINGKDKPEELMLFKFRKQPWSVYFKWLGIEGHNRECIYVKGRYGNLIHTLLAEGDVMLMPAGKKISLSPTSPLVTSRSRHSITDAGIGQMIDIFGKVVDALEAGDKRYGTMKYLGQLRRPEFEQAHIAIEQAIPPGAETTLPQGGSRLWLFDPESGLPVLMVTTDHTNHEVEYYCYDRIQYPVKLDDDDFNPDRVWKQK